MRGGIHAGSRLGYVLLLFLALVLLPSIMGMSPRKSTETGMVRVLYIGEPVGGPGPYRFMAQDPFLDLTPVQATTAWYELEVIKRSLRIYMPRSYSTLTSDQDVIVLSDANRNLFTSMMLKWFADGVVENGMGLLMTGGRESFGAYFGMPDWTPTSVGQILPVVSTARENGPDGKVVVQDPDNIFMQSLPWDSIGRYGYFFGSNPVREREGSKVLAELVPSAGDVNPLLVWSDVGNGRTFAMTSDWTPTGANLFLNWEFYPDYTINLMLFISSVEIPPDPFLVHRIRMELEEYHLKRNFLLSLIEFVARFGANPDRVGVMMKEADEGLREANEMYKGYNFEGSFAKMEELVLDLDQATIEALRIKDQALLWIYIVEWTAVTGTSLIAGVVVWALMVRRRLYRVVGSTRSSH
jgi:uncharacterized membrane protein